MFQCESPPDLGVGSCLLVSVPKGSLPCPGVFGCDCMRASPIVSYWDLRLKEDGRSSASRPIPVCTGPDDSGVRVRVHSALPDVLTASRRVPGL